MTPSRPDHRGASQPAVPPGRPALRAQRKVAFPRRLFCQELAVLLDAGIPLYEALQTLCEKEAHAPVAQVLRGLTLALSQGQTLSQAMRARLLCALSFASSASSPALRVSPSGSMAGTR